MSGMSASFVSGNIAQPAIKLKHIINVVIESALPLQAQLFMLINCGAIAPPTRSTTPKAPTAMALMSVGYNSIVYCL